MINDVLDYCPSISVQRELFDCGMMSHYAYLVTTEHPDQARQEIRDRLAELIHTWRRKQQALERKRANTAPRNRRDIPLEEVQAIALEVCQTQGRKSAIDGFKAWDSIKVNLFHGNPKEPWPDDAESIATMTMDHYWEEVEETLHYRRTEETDELWASSLQGSRKAVSARRHGAQKRAVIRLLAILVRAGAGWVQATNGRGEGRVSTSALFIILNTIHEHLAEQKEKTRQAGSESPIVKTARDLGLHPVPSREGRPGWQAQCPSRNHFIDIDAGSEYWFCGYCGEKGGPRELEDLVAARRKMGTRP